MRFNQRNLNYGVSKMNSIDFQENKQKRQRKITFIVVGLVFLLITVLMFYQYNYGGRLKLNEYRIIEIAKKKCGIEALIRIDEHKRGKYIVHCIYKAGNEAYGSEIEIDEINGNVIEIGMLSGYFDD
jgi:hypothetical protein